MRTGLKATVIIDTEKFGGFHDVKIPLTLDKIKEAVDKGKYVIEWINSDLQSHGDPILIIKI